MFLYSLFRSFFGNQSGNIALPFALASVALVGIGGGVVDYASKTMNSSHLQSVADAAVLVAANELKLSGSQNYQSSTIDSVALSYVNRNVDKGLKAPTVNVTVSKKEGIVDLKVTSAMKTSFYGLLGLSNSQPITASARAQIFGGLPLCVLALSENESSSIAGNGQAKLTSTGCSVHSNSVANNSIEVWGQALLRTGLTCAAGGAQGSSSNYIPSALSDCPPVPDPLASRVVAIPTNQPCDHTRLQFSSGTHILQPGKYCQGLKLTGNANVEFLSGLYHFEGGQFEITGKAKATGEYVGFTFSGINSSFKFSGQANVQFYAPKDGQMAGLLFYEKPIRPESLNYEITSPNVEKLVGTIYLPKGSLQISVNGGDRNNVAEGSEFTVILAQTLKLKGKSNLVLNTDFAATDVPVPQSIERLSGQIVLAK